MDSLYTEFQNEMTSLRDWVLTMKPELADSLPTPGSQAWAWVVINVTQAKEDNPDLGINLDNVVRVETIG